MRRFAFPVLLVVAGLALALGASELALRAAPPAVRNPPRKPLPPDLPKLEGIFALAKPNTRGNFKGILFETNALGIRDREHPIPRHPETYRIALIGDSFTMGSGVDVEDSYADRLQKRLAPRVEVINLGLSGFNTKAAIDRLQSIGTLYDPDLVVYGWTINDLEGEDYRATRAKNWRRGPRSRWAVARLAGDSWHAIRDRFFPHPRSLVHEFYENYFDNPAAWTRFEEQLARLRRVADDAGICAAVFLHPFLYHLEFAHPFLPIYDAVEEAARAKGLATIPTIDRFLGRRSQSLWVGAADSHPNAEGHAILADALDDGLAALPARCGFRPDRPRATASAGPGRGYTLVAPRGTRRVTWTDTGGEVAHEIRLPRVADSVEQLPSGNLLTVGGDGALYEYDPRGNEVWRYEPDRGEFHDTVLRSSRGTTFAPERRRIDGARWTDTIVEIGVPPRVIWKWNAPDDLDPTDRGPREHSPGDAREWPGLNSIDEFPDGDLLVGLEIPGRRVRIDYPSGEIVWQKPSPIDKRQATAQRVSWIPGRTLRAAAFDDEDAEGRAATRRPAAAADTRE